MQQTAFYLAIVAEIETVEFVGIMAAGVLSFVVTSQSLSIGF
jgi:hypothetical protein